MAAFASGIANAAARRVTAEDPWYRVGTGIVNIWRTSMCQSRGFLMPRGFGMAGPSTDHVRSRDAATTLPSEDVPPGRHAEGPQKWHKMALLQRNSSVCTPVYAEVGNRDLLGSSFGISHRTGIGSLGEQRQGVHRSAIDKRPAPPHGVVLSFHFPILVCAIFPTFVRVRSRVGRTSQPFTTAAFSVLVHAGAGSRPYRRRHTLGESYCSLHK